MSTIHRLLRAVTPLSFRNALRDTAERVRWHFASSATGLARHGLTKTQIYPDGWNFIPVLQEATSGKLAALGLNGTTPVASIGTCFAEEFAIFMRSRAYNYVSTESNVFHASANWGRVYTIPNLLQIVRYSFQEDFPLAIEAAPKGWFDPLREHSVGVHSSRGAAESAIRQHRKASRDAFSAASVLILTVGQNESWIEMPSGLVWAQIPPEACRKDTARRFEAREFTYEENVSGLSAALEILFRVNPRLQVLMTVSPVPSYATFCDTDVVTQSFAHKCLLRIVVRDVIRRLPGRAFYFPSFEMVLGWNRDNFRADNRHVKHATVSRILDSLVQSTQLKNR